MDRGDVALLRRFEPVIRYTRGERFYPMDAERYVGLCSLWVQRPDQEAVCLIPREDLTMDRLAEPHPEPFEAISFLQLDPPPALADQEPVPDTEPANPQSRFRAGLGRLARVGMLSRFTDALFSLSLLARGRVPGRTATAAARLYQRLLDGEECIGA